MLTIDEPLTDLDIALPDVMPPVVDGYVPAFAPFVRSGDQIQLFGRLGKKDGKPICGKVGEEISLEEVWMCSGNSSRWLSTMVRASCNFKPGGVDNLPCLSDQSSINHYWLKAYPSRCSYSK
jgi:hypothetical protein